MFLLTRDKNIFITTGSWLDRYFTSCIIYISFFYFLIWFTNDYYCCVCFNIQSLEHQHSLERSTILSQIFMETMRQKPEFLKMKVLNHFPQPVCNSLDPSSDKSRQKSAGHLFLLLLRSTDVFFFIQDCTCKHVDN